MREALGRYGNDTEGLIGEADTQKKDALVASSCLYTAAMLFYNARDISNMIAALEQIDTDFPESPYAPEYYRRKIKYYLSGAKPKVKDAAAIAQKYGDASRTRTWSAAYQLDAEFCQ